MFASFTPYMDQTLDINNQTVQLNKVQFMVMATFSIYNGTLYFGNRHTAGLHQDLAS